MMGGFGVAQITLASLVAMLGVATAGEIGPDNRRALNDYAAEKHVDPQAIRSKYAASGRIQCPFGEASAFLVYRNNIVVTARHVLFPEKEMNTFAGKTSIRRCAFEIFDGSKSIWYQVDVHSFIYLNENQRSIRDRFDWVAMKLVTPVPKVIPYSLPDKLPPVGSAVTLATIRQDGFPHNDWNERIFADCKIMDIQDIDSKAFSGIKTDCSAATGASGGALLMQFKDRLSVIGVQSSVSAACSHYDNLACFSFAVGMYSDFRDAIKKLARTP